MSQVELNSREYNCKNCGSILHFDPQTQCLKCNDCKSTFALDKQRTFTRKPVLNDVALNKKRDEWVTDNKVFKCNNCGGSVIANKFDISSVCPYCGTNLTVQLDELPGLKPDGIVPFAFDKQTAGDKFVENVKHKFYVSGAFKRHLPLRKIHGTYIPSFVFDIDTQSSYKGVLVRQEKRNDHVYSESFPISGNLNKRYMDVLIESSSKMTQPQLNGILPFNTKQALNYQNGYILGYTVEHYADTLLTCEKTAQEVVSSLIRRDILSKYHYDSVQSLKINTKYSNPVFNYLLVPVYKFEYTYKDKPFITLMNGQTGKVDNNLPKSIPKIVLTVVACLLIVLLPFILSFI